MLIFGLKPKMLVCKSHSSLCRAQSLVSRVQNRVTSVRASGMPSGRQMKMWQRVCGIGAAVMISSSTLVACAASAEDSDKSDDQPPNFKYTHLWTSKDGKTHISECMMKGFELKEFASGGAQQYVRTAGGNPEKVSFTQLKVGNVNPYHNCPGTQFVAVMKGSWYVKTTDGTKRVFQPGEVMFQDNSKDNPAEGSPEHESGTEGDEPCNQMVIQVDRCPEVDKPCPF